MQNKIYAHTAAHRTLRAKSETLSAEQTETATKNTLLSDGRWLSCAAGVRLNSFAKMECIHFIYIPNYPKEPLLRGNSLPQLLNFSKKCMGIMICICITFQSKGLNLLRGCKNV